MKHVFTFFLLLITYTAVAQYKFPKQELATAVKGKTLAVQLLNETDESDKNINAALQDAFTTNWKLTPVEFFSPADIKQLRESRNEKYAVLTQQDELKKDIRTYYIDNKGRRQNFGGASGQHQKFKYSAFTFSYYDFDLILFQKKKEVNVTSISFANGELSKADYLYLTQQLSRLVENAANATPMKKYYSVDRNIETLKNYNLVLLNDFFKEKERPEIDKNYENKFELVDYEKYEDVILSQEANTGYVKIIWSNQHETYAWVVVDSQDGSILSLLSFGGVRFGKNHDANDIIKVKHLKYITAKGGQNLNNRYK
ncbi:hypothetical protein D770_12825 [Flammeovirgaceae bacterium 311]|nr:hypothetical protein D770_12825 [Flammeovirgaceae bacterium 311]